MEDKKFNCKIEDVPVITGFVLTSMENDKVDFFAYSPVFNNQFMTDVKLKQTFCNELVKSGDVVKQQKALTAQLAQKLVDMRISLNPFEGYLKLAGSALDIQMSDFGLKPIRTAIANDNVEGLLFNAQSFVSNLKRNITVLEAKGLKPEVLTALTTLVAEIAQLNQQQNELKNKRSRVANDNMKDFNELWDMFSPILDAGRALYRGVNDVKLKEYTYVNLLKRVHSENGSKPEIIEPKVVTAV